MAVQAHELGVTYGERVLFTGLSIAVEPGECLLVTGSNGAGKSTFLRCLYGSEQPTTGQVTVCGLPADERCLDVRRRVSVLFDDSALFDELTPRHHVDMLLRGFGQQSDADALLAGVGLAAAADLPVVSLSAGQRRRLLLLGATARPHNVLLLDEPERALDAEGRAWLRSMIEADRARGAAVVVASHSDELVDAFGDAVLDLM